MSTSFAQWLREPHKNLRGTIQQPDDYKKRAYIRPYDFPEERLFFRYSHWTASATHRALQTREVEFDVNPQPNWKPELNAEATNVRLVSESAA